MFTVIRLHILVDNLITIAYHHLNEHRLHLIGLLPGGSHRQGSLLHWGTRSHTGSTWGSTCCWRTITILFTLLILPDHLVHRGDERRLIEVQAVGTVGDIRGAYDLIRYQRQTLDNRTDSLRSLDRIGNTIQQELALKLYTVTLMRFDILFEVGSSVLSCKTVRILSLRQEQQFEVDALGQHHVDTFHSGMLAGIVIIINQDDVIRKTAQRTSLMYTEGRSRSGHDILYATLVHGDHIGLSFHDIHTTLLIDGFLGLIDAVELTILMVEVRGR